MSGFGAFMSSMGGQAAMSGLSSAAADWRQAHFNRQVVRDARSYNDSVLSTMYQKTVGDMKKAGLNPALAYEAGGVSKASGGPGVPSGAIQKGGGMSLEGLSAANLNSAQAGKLREETRSISAEADRNQVIADVLKKLGPRIEQGIGAVENSAKAGGDAVGRIADAIRGVMPRPPLDRLQEGITDLIERGVPLLKRMPPAVVPEVVKDFFDKGSRLRSPRSGDSSSAWGMSEYERAQEERRARARQSPASRRRGQ